MKRLKISIVSSHDVNENDFKIQELFRGLCDELKNEFESFPYNRPDFINFTFNSEPEQIEQDCLTTINPSKYLLCKKELGDKIIPLVAIKKVYQDLPYFPSFFIANKNSTIDSIRSKEIRTVYTVSKNSTSGYISPIFKLWESGIIKSPNEQGIEKNGWDLKIVGSHKEVEQRILDDKYAIGATGQFTNQENPKNALVKVLLRYYYLPQDVLVISKNLSPYEDYIKEWFYKIFSKESEWIPIFFNSSNKITGLYPLNDEFLNAMKELEIMTNYVQNFEEKTTKSDSNLNQKKDSENLLISSNLKEMIRKNKLGDVIEDLIKHFRTLNNEDVLNQIIMHSNTFYSISNQKNLSIADDDRITIKKNQLIKAVLNLIDTELKNI